MNRARRPLAVLAAVLIAAPASPARALTGALAVWGMGGPDPSLDGAARLKDSKLDESRIPGQPTLLGPAEIRASGAKTLQELLGKQLGVVTFDEVGNDVQQTVDLRGFNGSPAPATAVFVDGVRVNEPNLGQVNWHLIPLENIERVEIDPGPSTLNGKGALGGSIQITTKRGAPGFVAEAGAGYGSNQRRKGYVSVGDAIAGLDYQLFASHENDPGFRRQSYANIGTAEVKLGKKTEATDTVFSYQRVDDRLQQPGSLTGSEIAQDPDQNVSRVDTVSSLNFFNLNERMDLGEGFSLAANGHLRQRREATPLNQGRTSVSNFLVDMTQTGATGQLTYDTELGERRSVAAAGVEYDKADADSTGAGSFGFFSFTNSTFARDQSLGVFAQENIDLIPKTLILTAGLRHDHAKLTYVDRVAPSNSGSQEFQRANPRVGLNWNPAPFFGAYALYSEAFRTPTVSEITALGPFSQSPLRPVKARNWELGAHAELPKDVRVRAAAFLEDARDDIYAVFDPTAGFGQNVNIDKTRRWGVEWSAKAKLAEPADVEVKHTFTRATFGSSFVLDKVPFGSTQQVKKGDRIPMVPQHRVSATLTVRPAQGWRTSLDGTCVSSQHLFGDEANQEPQLPAYCTVNLGLAYERGGWSAFVNGYNMLDSRYNVRGILSTNPTTFQADRFLIPAPGINFFGGVSYRFSARK